MSDLKLDDIEITGLEQCAVDESVKLNGPPGTGKTTESAARVATLLDDHGYGLDDVLWATYRHSLAMETLQRLANWDIIPDSELSDPTKGPTRFIATIHACASRLVGGLGDVPTWYDRKEIATDRGLRFGTEQPWDNPGGQLLFNVFEYAANNKLDLHNVRDREQIPMMDDLREKYRGDVGRAFDEWQDWKAQNEKFDFWEQLEAPLKKDVTPDKPVVVIDEYHDATPLMAELSEMWIEQAEVAIVAGDPLQVVNTYTGARPEFFERLDLPEVLLDTTHRVPEESWAVATDVLSNAHSPPPVDRKKSGSFHDGVSPSFEYNESDGWRVPGEETSRSPGSIVASYGDDTMFLTRTQRQAAGVAAALEKAGVLYEVQNSMDISGWGGGEEMSDRTALYNALQRLKDVSLETSGVSTLMDYSRDRDRSVSDIALPSREVVALLDHTSHNYLEQSRSDTTDVANRLFDTGDPVSGEELKKYVTDEFWQFYTMGHGSVRHLIKSAGSKVGERLQTSDIGSLESALMKNDDPIDSIDTKVYTIHASKGTEARNVVVYDGITTSIEDSMLEKEHSRQNEYRTWYVALTRADANTFVLRDAFDWTSSFLPEDLTETARIANQRGVNA